MDLSILVFSSNTAYKMIKNGRALDKTLRESEQVLRGQTEATVEK